MITLTGTLQTIAGGTALEGKVKLALRGYGGQVPVLPGKALFGDVSPDEIDTGSDGTFSTELWGNDAITPAGTYYVLTVFNLNGDIVQTNAYLIVGADRSIDVSTLQPIDPSTFFAQPLQPPNLVNRMVAVPWAANLILNGAAGLSFEIAPLQADTVLSFTAGVPGNLYTFITQQASNAAHVLSYDGTAIHGGSAINPTLSGRLVQTFVCRSNDTLDSIGTGVYL